MCGVAQWFPRDKHDGAKTIALVAGIKRSTPLLSLHHCLGRSACRRPRNPQAANHGAVKLLRFARPSLNDGPDEICWRRRRLVVQTKSALRVEWRPWLADQSIDVRVTEEPEGATRAETMREQYGS